MFELLAPYWGFIKGLSGIVVALLTSLVQWYQLAERNGIMPSPGWMILITVAIGGYLGSGFAAATISETRGRGVALHFWFGLLLPGLYPSLLYSVMTNRTQAQVADRVTREKERQHRQTVDLTVRLMDHAGQEYHPSEKPDDTPAAEAAPEEPASPFNKIYFAGIAMRPDGTPAGPFAITLNDGRILMAEMILEILDDVLIVQIASPNGQPRKLRLTYDLIGGCELKSV